MLGVRFQQQAGEELGKRLRRQTSFYEMNNVVLPNFFFKFFWNKRSNRIFQKHRIRLFFLLHSSLNLFFASFFTHLSFDFFLFLLKHFFCFGLWIILHGALFLRLTQGISYIFSCLVALFLALWVFFHLFLFLGFFSDCFDDFFQTQSFEKLFFCLFLVLLAFNILVDFV